ncbi:phage capsid protein [Secundilactobacillus kimchicus]|uniref:phage capsid protein n=1 Tax=Secundilactobacillus kimchicus TaxID=528209 RepID=UPI0024A88705|nr:phage capsid protein [Secundilactobacillus kimchicus]
MSTINGQVTDLSANFIPEIWLDYLYELTTETNAFLNSGIIKNDATMGPMLLQRGYYATRPHVQHIDTNLNSQKWDNKHDITVNALDSFTDNQVKIYEAQAFGNSDFDDLITGAKTIDQITSQFATYWASIDEKRLMQVLKIAFMNETIKAAKSFHVGAEAEFKAEDFVKAMARMGDVSAGKPNAMAVNSATYNFMLSQNLIDFTQPSVGALPIGSYNGLAIVQDDQVPLTVDGKTIAYIFAPGSVDYSIATPANGVTVDRDNLKQGGIQAIAQKRVATIQVAGTSADLSVHSQPDTWKEAIDDGTEALFKPTNDVRNISVIEYGFTIDKDFVVPGVNTTGGSKTSTPKSANSVDSSTDGTKAK